MFIVCYITNNNKEPQQLLTNIGCLSAFFNFDGLCNYLILFAGIQEQGSRLK